MTKKILSLIAMLLFFLASVAVASNEMKIPPGKFYKIPSGEIYTVSYGNGPTVIFESGLGSNMSTWDKVAPEIAKNAHVVLYDRAGVGKSRLNADNKKMRTAKDAAADLLALLDTLQLKPPYILVGQSLGGLYVQYFARMYPDKIAAVVLVDSVNPNQKIYGSPPEESDEGYYEEIGFSESQKEVKEAKPFPHSPLMILSATIHGPLNGELNSNKYKKQWSKLQDDLAMMSPKSQHITANNTKHDMANDKPWLVIAGIEEIIKNAE